MREMYLCVHLCVYISETYLFLTSTQWRENQTKGLEPSDTKTILYSQSKRNIKAVCSVCAGQYF